MKFLTVLLATSIVVQAGSVDPGQAAIEFLEKVRERRIDLEPGGDTALSPQTGGEKKRQIAKRLERLAEDLGKDPLEIGSIKQDDSIAAVLVRKVGGFDPGRMQVYPITLVRKGAEWIAAPVPASFENSGAMHAASMRDRLRRLEDWMLREQVTDLLALREQAASRMREKISGQFQSAHFKDMNSGQIAEAFVAACEKRDLPTVLGLLGGLSSPFPEDWQKRLVSAERALLSGSEPPGSWKLLTDDRILKITVDREEQGSLATISIVFLDPTEGTSSNPESRFHVIHLNLSKETGGIWQINLPQGFFQDPEAEDDSEVEVESDLINLFPQKWLERYPASPKESPERLMDSLAAAFRSKQLNDLLSICRIAGTPEANPYFCLRAAELWWTVQDLATVRQAIPLSFTIEGSYAVGLMQFFSGRNPDQQDFRPVYFEKTSAGWLWVSIPDKDTVSEFKAWVSSESARWSNRWQEKLLQNVPVLTQGKAPVVASQDDARQCVRSYLDALRKGDLTEVLSHIAILPQPKSGFTALQNINYEMMEARRSDQAIQISDSFLGKYWNAIAIRSASGPKTETPLYPVVQTAVGAKILVEIDLFASASRSRQFLNQTAIDRLRKAVGNEAAVDMESLFKRYQSGTETEAEPADQKK